MPAEPRGGEGAIRDGKVLNLERSDCVESLRLKMSGAVALEVGRQPDGP
jgi:hypothetical protein